MSEPLDELEIRAMLDARAGRVHPAAAREILAAVATRLDRPGSGLDVPVRPVTVVRPPIRRRAWLGAGMAAVVVVALVGVLLLGVPPGRIGLPVGGSPSAAATQAPVSPVASLPADLTVAELRLELASGQRDGQVVLMTAALKVTPLRCPAGDCQRVDVIGLEGIEIRYWITTASSADIRTAIAAHPRQVPTAFRIDAHALVLLGWPQQDPATPMTVRQLLEPAPEILGDDLAVVAGWLIGAPAVPASCAAAEASASRCSGALPALTDTEPVQDGRPHSGDAVEVTVDESLGLEPAAVAIPGPFLLRRVLYRGGDLPPYQVVASLAPATAVLLGTIGPSIPNSSPAPAGVLSAAQLRDGLDDGSLEDHLILVDGDLDVVSVPCPTQGLQCVVHAIRGFDGVPVVDDGPLARSMGTPVPATGLLVFRGGHGSLTYLGRAPGQPGQPVTVAKLLAGGDLPAADALVSVSGWLVVGGIHTSPAQLPGATPYPGPAPWLTDDKPFPEGMLASSQGTNVLPRPPVLGRPTTQVVTEGPFLVRRVKASTCDFIASDPGPACAGGPVNAWQVVAVFDPEITVRATVP